MAFATACLLAAAFAGRPRISIEGVDTDDLPPNKELDIPAYIRFFDDDSFYQTLKTSDVVVMYVREQHCPDCDYFAEMYYNATKELHGVPGVVLGQIDAHEEGDLFTEYHGVEEDLPALLVFKSEETLKYHKKPIQFVINTRIADDLPPFVRRLCGPPSRAVASAADLDLLLADASAHADGVGFAFWTSPHAGKKMQKIVKMVSERVAERERFNTVFGVVAQGVQAPGLEPFTDADDKGCYLVSYETTTTPVRAARHALPSRKPEVNDIQGMVKKALQWISHEKTKRVGHKYDNIGHFFTDDLEVPANHSSPDVEKLGDEKRYVRVWVEGRATATNTQVFTRELEFVTHENATMVAIEEALPGMSVGMRRMVVAPPAYREGWRYGTLELHESTQLLVELRLQYIGPTNEMPGRIEWETDPEKIAEHKRKSAEQDRLRKEAIARGEDPDAQCASKKADN